MCPRALSESVTPVRYSPPPGYTLDVELYRGPELRRRARDIEGRLERIDFHVILYLTRGRYRHMVDFQAIDCAAGSVVILRPGQVHRFGDVKDFEGWLLIFRAELLPPTAAATDLDRSSQLDALPTRLVVPRSARSALTECLERMARDARRAPSAMLNSLLLSQLNGLIARVCLEARDTDPSPPDRAIAQRFFQVRATVEQHFHHWHGVHRYAKHLGCSEKSLNRAVRRFTDMSAKQFITARIVLEAKRLLAHTLTPVAGIADQLGFDEPTNFVKFFRRETRTTPGAFRRQIGSGS